MSDRLTTQLKSLAKSEGADLVGIASIQRFRNVPKGYTPKDILRSAKFTITLGIHLLDSVVETTPSREYAIHTRVVNSELNQIAYRIARFLEDSGYVAIPVPASYPSDSSKHMGDLSHRHAAVFAGLGQIGRNSLLVTPQYGPRVRLVTVVTNAPLKPDPPLKLDLCKGCDICIRACPAGALAKNKKTDKKKCVSYSKEIRKKFDLDSRYCGLCIKVCPIGKKHRSTLFKKS
jgi:epoxyqueuosine reductase QueG